MKMLDRRLKNDLQTLFCVYMNKESKMTVEMTKEQAYEYLTAAYIYEMVHHMGHPRMLPDNVVHWAMERMPPGTDQRENVRAAWQAIWEVTPPTIEEQIARREEILRGDGAMVGNGGDAA